MRQVILKLFLSESDCNVPMEVEGTDGSHTLVGVLGGGTANHMLGPEVSSKSQTRTRNLKD